MPANTPDLTAIQHLGSQFNTNIFASAQKGLTEKSKKYAAAHVSQQRQTAASRERFARSAAQGINKGRANFARQQQAQQKQASQAAKAHAAGVKSGRVAPAQGAPPRTFAMGSGPQGSAQTQQNKTMQQQRNFAHGQAIQMQNQMSRAEAAANAVNQRHAAGVHAQAQKAAINLNLSQEKHKAGVEAHAAKAAASINALAQKQQMQQSHQAAMASGKQKAFDIAGAQKLELQGYVNKQKLQHQAAMHAQKQSQKPVKRTSSGKATTVQPSLSPSFSSAPTRQEAVKPKAIPQTSFSSQLAPQKPLGSPQGSATASFSSGSGNGAAKPATAPRKPPVSSQFSSGPKVGGSFPQHSHPEGSSTTPLPKLTAAQPKPNEFTTGSRNAKPGGLAAKGSQLESWAIGRQAEIRKQRGSNNTQLKFGEQ